MNDKCKNCTIAPIDRDSPYCQTCLLPKIDQPFYVNKNDQRNKHEQKPKNRWNKAESVEN